MGQVVRWARTSALLLVLVLLTELQPAAAGASAAALPPALQAGLDRALLDYGSGRLQPAARAFQHLARQEVPVAQYNLAVMHLRQELPGASPLQARRWMQRAANAGFVTAQHGLGQALESGAFGRRDLVLAHDWYQRAAEAGSVDAQLALGTAYYLGRGRAADSAQAAHWFREAAKGGDVGAMYLLASMYEKGAGIAADRRLARYWYAAAAAQGDEAAPGKVKDLDAASAGSGK